MLRDAQQVSGRREPARRGAGSGIPEPLSALPKEQQLLSPSCCHNEDDLTFQREVAGPDSFVKSPDVYK